MAHKYTDEIEKELSLLPVMVNIVNGALDLEARGNLVAATALAAAVARGLTLCPLDEVSAKGYGEWSLFHQSEFLDFVVGSGSWSSIKDYQMNTVRARMFIVSVAAYVAHRDGGVPFGRIVSLMNRTPNAEVEDERLCDEWCKKH